MLLISVHLIDQTKQNDTSTAESGSEFEEFSSPKAPAATLELKLMPVDEEVSATVISTRFDMTLTSKM